MLATIAKAALGSPLTTIGASFGIDGNTRRSSTGAAQNCPFWTTAEDRSQQPCCASRITSLFTQEERFC